MNYYNENNPHAAAWLRELIRCGLIPNGHVDDRSIHDVRVPDLSGFAQCHFFAGIGGWPLALQLAGVSPATPLWTGSAPCQPFSSAGKGLGLKDSRHLFPVWAGLVEECRPSIIFGEQVASRAGRGWLAGIRSHLEALDYDLGCADLCAAGEGSPHIRQRLYWMAHSTGQRRREGPVLHQVHAAGHPQPLHGGRAGGLAHSTGLPGSKHEPESRPGLSAGPQHTADSGSPPRSGAWSHCDLISCADGKARRVESGTFPLVDGFSGRVGLLRGYGNAIVPQVAATFIRCAIESAAIVNHK